MLLRKGPMNAAPILYRRFLPRSKLYRELGIACITQVSNAGN